MNISESSKTEDVPNPPTSVDALEVQAKTDGSSLSDEYDLVSPVQQAIDFIEVVLNTEMTKYPNDVKVLEAAKRILNRILNEGE